MNIASNTRRSLVLGLAALALATATCAQTSAAAATAEGTVRKVDKAAAKITLTHGEIKNLEMPPMTMVFGVRDKALLDKVKAGDKVVFTAIDVGGGQLVLTGIEPLK